MTASQKPPEEILVDDDLTLRRWQQSDVDALYAAASTSIAELSSWMPWAADGYTRGHAVDFLSRSTAKWNAGEEFNYALIIDGGCVGGSCGLMSRAGPGGLEIGYWLATDATGRGLATRAAAQLARVALEDLGVEFVQIRHDRENKRSEAIPRRLGFECRGAVRPIDKQDDDAAEATELLWQLDRDSPLKTRLEGAQKA